jgi:hypothetical protein
MSRTKVVVFHRLKYWDTKTRHQKNSKKSWLVELGEIKGRLTEQQINVWAWPLNSYKTEVELV